MTLSPLHTPVTSCAQHAGSLIAIPTAVSENLPSCKYTNLATVIAGSVALEQGMGLDSSHPRQAEIIDQLSLFQFLQGKLPEAELHARRSLAIIQDHFDVDDPAVCMCELRLGVILFSKLPFSLSIGSCWTCSRC